MFIILLLRISNVTMDDNNVGEYVPDGYSFVLCLSHDVDRVEKTYQGLYHAVRDRDTDHLVSALSADRPYWGFDEVMALENDLGVRSSFNFLDEKRLLRDKSPREWLDPRCWIRYNYYDLESPELRAVIQDLDAGGWEIGLHGSYDSPTDRERLAAESAKLERIVGHPVVGGRQHFLNFSGTETWRHYRAIGLGYDSSIGSGRTVGFRSGYGVKRPFDDGFVVFPLTAMDQAVMGISDDIDVVWAQCKALLEEALENRAVMTIDWHQRVFSAPEFPDWGTVYRRLVERALEMGAWVGPPGELYEHIQATCQPSVTIAPEVSHVD